jgi:hypothetical protein
MPASTTRANVSVLLALVNGFNKDKKNSETGLTGVVVRYNFFVNVDACNSRPQLLLLNYIIIAHAHAASAP